MKRCPALAPALTSLLILPFHVVTVSAQPAAGIIGPASPFQYLSIDDLPQVAGINGGLEAWVTPAELTRDPADTTFRDHQSMVAVVHAAALADAKAQEEAHSLVSSGTAVVVVAQPGETRYDASVFGVRGNGDIVWYQPTSNGSMQVLTVARHDDEATRVAMWAAARDRALAPPAAGPGRSRVRRATGSTPADMAIDAPRKEWFATETYPGGRYASNHVTVTRDITSSSDRKIVTIKSELAAVPDTIGVASSPGKFRRNGEGDLLAAVNEYEVNTSITWPAGSAPLAVHPLMHYPETTSQMNVDLTKTYSSVSTSTGSVSAELGVALKALSVEVSGKVTTGFSSGKSQTVTETVNMKTDDYSIAFRQAQSGRSWNPAWTFRLAGSIAADARYFDVGGRRKSTQRMTPMMHEAALETLSSWSLPGTYEGTLRIATQASVSQLAWFDGGGPSWARDYITNLRASEKHAIDCAQFRTDCDGSVLATMQPAVLLDIDLSTPFLTRNPAVLLQSFEGENLCISQVARPQGSLAMVPCDRSESRRDMQWMLDDASRYVNRHTSQCLEVARASNIVHAAGCSDSMRQKWEWRADRIHSQAGDGTQRMEVIDGTLFVDLKNRLPIIPTNVTHRLLKPWGSYPDAPYEGDLVPGFTGRGEPVPRSFLSFKEIPDTERWATVPLRFGIDHAL